MKKRVLSLIAAVLLCVQMMPAMVVAAAENTIVDASSESLPFTDVKSGDWFCDPVGFVYNHKIMTGMTETYFGAAENLSRAQFAAVLYRMEGEPAADEKQVFPDVPVTEETRWYADAVVWANEAGVIRGCIDGTFGPADDITREQVAAMLCRYEKYCGYEVSAGADLSEFPDAKDVSDWAMEAMQWAVGNGIITGQGGKYLDPQGKATRAECAAMAARFMQGSTYSFLIQQARALLQAGKEEEFFAFLSGAADTGDAAMQCALADCYMSGHGVEPNAEEAVKYYQLAADQNYYLAYSPLGYCLFNGIGTEKDEAKGIAYIQRAADQGDVWAQGMTAYWLICQKDPDYGKIIAYAAPAAEQGEQAAQYVLGKCFELGLGTETDPEEAARLYALSAEQGYPPALYALGYCFYYGAGVEQNVEKAVDYIQESADLGYDEALYCIGQFYYEGRHFEQSFEKAVEYYQLAAEQGNRNARFSLGFCYYAGEGVEQSYEEALKYFRLAADQGHPTAVFCIGECYYKGNGVEKDLAEAAKWYRKALDAGYEPDEEDQEHLIEVLGEGYDKK